MSGVFGVHGEVRLFLYNPDSALFDAPRQVTLALPQGGARQVVRVAVRPGAGKRILARIDGVGSPEAAAALVGAEILVPRTALPAPAAGEWYHCDLLGARVRTASGRPLGELVEIHDTGGADVWVVRGPEGEWYIPALLSLIVSVRPREEVVVADAAAQEAL